MLLQVVITHNETVINLFRLQNFFRPEKPIPFGNMSNKSNASPYAAGCYGYIGSFGCINPVPTVQRTDCFTGFGKFMYANAAIAYIMGIGN